MNSSRASKKAQTKWYKRVSAKICGLCSYKSFRAVPEYCWLSRLVSGMAPNQGPSVFPIALPTVLGDTLKFERATGLGATGPAALRGKLNSERALRGSLRVSWKTSERCIL